RFMKYVSTFRIGLSALIFALAACQPEPGLDGERATDAAEDTSSAPVSHSLVPLPGMEGDAPVLSRAVTVVLETTAGDVTIDVYPEAAPNAAQRFVELVESGFYDDIPVSRVVSDFVAQFGINWREPHSGWQSR